MDIDNILKGIIKDYTNGMGGSRTVASIYRKIENGTANYADAEGLARECGQILNTAFRNHLPEALTDGYLFREFAEVIVQEPLLKSAKDVASFARRIQQLLNQNANIGLGAVTPEINMDQITGIITGICNTPFSEGSAEFLDQVENLFLGYVDDFVHDNAAFQYEAGLSPTIERRTSGRCCRWCDGLAGVYPYASVSDRGSDVFKRHTNCKCQIIYDPGGSKNRASARGRR